MSAFNLRDAVCAVVDETDLASPREVAAKVAENVPADELRSVLAEALVDYVRDELTRLGARSASRGLAGTVDRSAKVTTPRLRSLGRVY